MKDKEKTRQSYRIAPDLVRLLDEAARVSRLPKTQILEDALDSYMGKGGVEVDARREFILNALNMKREKAPKPSSKMKKNTKSAGDILKRQSQTSESPAKPRKRP
jgi:predicted transcriptional regulator